MGSVFSVYRVVADVSRGRFLSRCYAGNLFDPLLEGEKGRGDRHLIGCPLFWDDPKHTPPQTVLESTSHRESEYGAGNLGSSRWTISRFVHFNGRNRSLPDLESSFRCCEREIPDQNT